MEQAFALRRQKVMDAIAPGAMVLFAAPVAYRNNDVEQEYRQDSDFYYLLGFEEPESVLVLTTGSSRRAVLFLRKRDAARETWDGPRLGVETAAQTLGIDEAYPISELDSKLKELLAGCEHLYCALGQDAGNDQLIFKTLRALRGEVRRGGCWPLTITEPGKIVHEMRLFKDEFELATLARALEITDRAHRLAMQASHPGVWEYELEAVLRAEFRRQGSPRVSYSPIVASGLNSTVLHHRNNDRQSCAGEFILIDAGCELGYQSTDITRTFPVDGKFTPIQRQAYEVVLTAQQRAIDAVRPGTTVDAIHDLTVRALCEGLLSMGILKGDLEGVVEDGSYKKYYMHRTSHWLGMDVHDVGRYHLQGRPRPLEPGMLLTVEPGLYFPPNDEGVPAGLRGSGIRIEDDILVTRDSQQNLSLAIPKTVEEIESLMNETSAR
jgi:Xaa-Pro aminopeptidase